MLFHSFAFFLFFLVTFAGYWALKDPRQRKGWLVIASCVFYGTWNPWLVFLILFTAAVDYLVALRLMTTESPSTRRALLALSISISLTLLVFFKYARFLASSTIFGLNLFGAHLPSPTWEIVLPLGISFYTFETISYVVDVYRRRVAAATNILDYALYILFFPHLIAGPIIRPSFFLPQTQTAKHFDWARLQLGAQYFLRGLFKKAVLADHLAAIVDPVFAAPATYSTSMIWLAVPCYAVQVYCDFSGYSDMAVGAAHAFGYKLPINFNLPYFSESVGEFWRRWHITLSTWLRDYVYIPLGGSRGSSARTYGNLILTLVICGLWHGAAWNFVVFGLYHGVILSLERALPLPAVLARRSLLPLRIAWTFLLLCAGLVIFRAHALSDAWLMWRRAVSTSEGQHLPQELVALGLVALALVFAGHLFGHFGDAKRWLERIPPAAMGFGMAGVFLLIMFLMPQDSAPFTYFQF
ncbi:MAG TPA: MBOAT family O-acyltransferase [Chthoniobacter sp.]|nr:MBOAT family O-acyltransferase [Chthoniobacter sp.]